MQRFELAIMRFIIGSATPITFFLITWGLSLLFLPPQKAGLVGIVGFFLGIICNLVWLRQRLRNVYALDLRILGGVYLFFNIYIYSFFMGIPLFNLLPGILAGIYMGRRLHHQKISGTNFQQIKQKTAVLTAVMMLIIFLISSIMLMQNSQTALELYGKLFNLGTTDLGSNFAMLILTLLGSGLLLVFGQYWLTKIITQWSYNLKDL